MPRIDIDVLMRILRISLFEEPVQDFPRLTDSQWQEFFSFSMRQKVVSLLHNGISRLPDDVRPSRSVWLRFCAERAKVEAKSARQSQALDSLAAFYHSHAIRTMLLKGPFLTSCYPCPHMRDYGDLDVYLFGDYQRADALVSNEFGIRVTHEAHHHTKFVFQGITVENHYDFLNTHAIPSNKTLEQMLKSLAADAGRGDYANPQVFLPSPDFNAIFLVRHLAGHFAAGQVTIRDLCDWCMFLHCYDNQVDWDEVSRVYNQYGLAQFVGALQAILSKYLLCNPIPQLGPSVDDALANRVLHEILFGEFSEPDFQGSGLGRLRWKWRRFRASSWKYSLVYTDPLASLFFSGLWAHLQRPKSLFKQV